MKRRQSVPHTFEENLAARKAALEAELAQLKPGPEMDAIRSKLEQLETAGRMGAWLKPSDKDTA
jgi:hypothetical protein